MPDTHFVPTAHAATARPQRRKGRPEASKLVLTMTDKTPPSTKRSATTPAVGLTFQQAAERLDTILAEFEAINEDTDPTADVRSAELAEAMNSLIMALAGGEPRTVGDCLAVLRIAALPCSPVRESDVYAPGSGAEALFGALLRSSAMLPKLLPDLHMGASTSPHQESSFIPSIGLTFRQAADRVRQLLDAHAADEDAGFPDGDGFQEDRRNEWHRLERAIYSTPACTIGDLLVKLERLVCPDLGASEKTQDEDEIAQIRNDIRRLVPAAEAVGDQQDDAGLFAAFRAYLEHEQRVNSVPAHRDPTDEETSPYHAARERLAAAPVGSLAGIMVKLAVAVATSTGAVIDRCGVSKDSESVRALEQARAAAAGLADPLMQRAAALLIDGIADLWDSNAFMHGMGPDAEQAPQRAATPADSFADTVAAFEAEAPAALALPQAPTDAMAQAGATAAGITPEQFASAYAAAVEAFKLGRAS